MLDNTGLYLQRKPTENHQIQSMGCRTNNLIIIIILSHNNAYITRVVTTCICLIYELWEWSIKCFLGQECCEIIVRHNLINVHQRECMKPMLQEEWDHYRLLRLVKAWTARLRSADCCITRALNSSAWACALAKSRCSKTTIKHPHQWNENQQEYHPIETDKALLQCSN